MEYSFPTSRKTTRVFMIGSAIILSVTLTGIGIMGLMDFYENSKLIIDPHRVGDFIAILILAMIGLAFACGAVVMIAKNPFSKQIIFNEKGITHESKNIFISWDDVKKISIISNRANSQLVISTLEGTAKFKDIYKQTKPAMLSIEWRREFIPMLNEYWDDEIENYSNLKNSDNSFLLYALIFEVICFIVLLFILLSKPFA